MNWWILGFFILTTIAGWSLAARFCILLRRASAEQAFMEVVTNDLQTALESANRKLTERQLKGVRNAFE